MKKPVVDLTCLDNFFGVIIPCASGVIFSNQVGGMECNHPQVEGIFIPLPSFQLDIWKDSAAFQKLEDFSDPYNSKLVGQLLDENDYMQGQFRPCTLEEVRGLSFDPSSNDTSVQLYEAWVPVFLQGAYQHPNLIPFSNQVCILTWSNSD